MKAAIHYQYGAPEVVSIKETSMPSPKSNEVLVKIYASSVNRTDSGFRSAEYFISRFWSGLFKPKYKTLGCEYAGEIIALGENVTRYKIGDRVFGYDDQKFGGHAAYKCVAEHDTIAIIPNHLSYLQAAALSEGSHYALGNIQAAQVQAGQHVLVYGATGAIGSAAVQLLKYYKAHVTAVCNTKNVPLLQSLLADEIIDYETQDFTKTNTKFDFVFDAVGKSSFTQCKPLMKPQGIYISTELGKNGSNIFLALLTPIFSSKKVLFPIPSFTEEHIQLLKMLAEQKYFTPVIDRVYPLDEIAEAYRYVETGQKTGNVIIEIVTAL
jgi:NADPH:quinone reductase-like Zn-dependent oxidoreductase